MKDKDLRNPFLCRHMPYHSRLENALSKLVVYWNRDSYKVAMGNIVGHGLDHSDADLVWRLAYMGPSRPSELAEELGTGRSNISKIINRAEAHGLVERLPNTGDGRSYEVSLTDKGASIAKRIIDVGDAKMRVLIRDWAPQDVARMAELVERMNQEASILYAALERGDTSEVKEEWLRQATRNSSPPEP